MLISILEGEHVKGIFNLENFASITLVSRSFDDKKYYMIAGYLPTPGDKNEVVGLNLLEDYYATKEIPQKVLNRIHAGVRDGCKHISINLDDL